jgi:hypothetical protein
MDRRRMASLHARLSVPDDVKLSNLGSLKPGLNGSECGHYAISPPSRIADMTFRRGVSATTAPMCGILGYNAKRDRRCPRRPPWKIQMGENLTECPALKCEIASKF